MIYRPFKALITGTKATLNGLAYTDHGTYESHLLLNKQIHKREQ